ncbi:MAG TPA: hypothetical protein VN370_08220, partial [Desulfitobacteriaceae bacterium]|nr:hypothetical protein [Desulfitobacteriaceae bacterium]
NKKRPNLALQSLRLNKMVNEAWEVKQKKLLKTRASIALYEQLRLLSEKKTALAVLHCQELIESEIETRILPEKKTWGFDYQENALTHDILSLDIQKYFQNIYSALNNSNQLISIIAQGYYQRFGIELKPWMIEIEPPVWQEMKVMTEEWYQMKCQTVKLTRQIEIISGEVWQQALDKTLGNLVFTTVFNGGRMVQTALAGLGIQAEAEAKELEIGLNQRLAGALSSIKQHLIQQLNMKVAELFYHTHDQVIDRKILLKIRQLKLAQLKFQQQKTTFSEDQRNLRIV